MRREKLYVRSVVADGLSEFIKSQGGIPQSIANSVDLKTVFQKENSAFISWVSICNIYEAAAEHLNDPYFGLKYALAQPDDFRTSGPNILLAMAVKDLREFLGLAVEYQKIHTNGVSYSYEEKPGDNTVTGVLSFHPLTPPCRQYSEHIMGVIAQMGMRNLKGFKILRVRFQHRSLGCTDWYEKVLGCPVEFDAERTELTLDSSILDYKVGERIKFGRGILRTYLKHQFSKNRRYTESIEMMVSGALQPILGVQKSDLESVADILEMNSKKLQRLLKDEGTSFSQVLDDTRKSMAERQLRDSNISINRLAGLLDYGSAEALSVASKRWFGETPSKYRQSLRARKH